RHHTTQCDRQINEAKTGREDGGRENADGEPDLVPLDDALTTVGQRSAIERIAWAFVKIHSRAEALGLLHRNALSFPFRQQDLADALGLSLVHTNKTLAKLRERQLASWSEGELRVMNREELARIAEIEVEQPRKRPLM
ncbi:hypothetical protein LCGC14_1809610, partial [marine sediment metagenome]